MTSCFSTSLPVLSKSLFAVALLFGAGCSARTGLGLPEDDAAGCECGEGEVCVEGACECEPGLVRRGNGCEEPQACSGGPSLDGPASFSLRHTLSGERSDFGLSVFARGGRVYVSRDDSPDPGAFRSYDPATDTDRSEPLPAGNPFCACGFNGVPVVFDDVMFHFANEAWRFDGTWAPLPYERANQRGEAASAVFGGKIFLIGGRRFENNSEVPATTMETYDPKSGTYAIAGEAPFADSRYLAAAAVGDRLYAIGQAGFAVYDGDAWETLPLPEGTFDRSPVAAVDNKLLVIPWPNASTFLVFDPVLGEWSGERALPEEASSFALAGDGCDLWLAGVADDGVRIYALDNAAD